MKTWASLLVGLVLALPAWSQEPLGRDNSPVLNKTEARLFASLVPGNQPAAAYTQKRLAFIAGVSGNVLLSKSEFFHRYLLQEQKPVLTLIPLTSAEQAASGGYQALVLMPVKLFTRKQKENIVRQLASQVKDATQ